MTSSAEYESDNASIDELEIIDDEVPVHYHKFLKAATKGKHRGVVIPHFKFSYCRDKDNLLAFRFFEYEHEGESLCKVFVETLEELGIADRLLGVILDNAANNSAMVMHLDSYYYENYPESGFSVAWNQIEYLAHVINLSAKTIIEVLKEPIDPDTYDAGNDSRDVLSSAVTRLSFIVRKIRNSPKIRRIMKKICEEEDKEG